MENRRNFIRKSIVGTLGAVSAAQFLNAGEHDRNYLDSINNGSVIQIQKKDFYLPLESIEITSAGEGTLKVLDAKGREYFSSKDKKTVFTASGALGYQMVLLVDKKGMISDMAIFKVNCKSEFEDSSEKYKHLLYLLLKSMTTAYHPGFEPVSMNNKVYVGYVNTSRDHIHALKGMNIFTIHIRNGSMPMPKINVRTEWCGISFSRGRE